MLLLNSCVLSVAKSFAITQFEAIMNKLEVVSFWDRRQKFVNFFLELQIKLTQNGIFFFQQESKELHTMLMDSLLENCD